MVVIAPPEAIPATPAAELDTALAAVHAQKDDWAQLSVSQQIALLDEVIESLPPTYERMAQTGAAAKRLPPNDVMMIEEWVPLIIISGIVRNLRLSLQEIQEHGKPQLPQPLRHAPDGRVIADVFPRTAADKRLGLVERGEVWFNHGVSADEVRAQMAAAQHTPPEGKVALILGAGNVANLLPGDFLHKLFVERQVVIFKLNPVNEYLGPLLEEGFAPLVEADYLRFVYGGVAEAQQLINDERVDELHITGSDATHDAIVFGTGAEGAARKAKRERLVTKRFTSELGNVTPVIIVPGPWTQSDLERVAAALVDSFKFNAGHYCLTPRLIVQHQEWPLREAFNAAIDAAMQNLRPRYSYYPQVDKRYQRFMDAHPDAKTYGGDELPWTFAPNVDPSNPDDPAFQLETFCGVWSETALSASSTEAFLETATAFLNDDTWGTLTATVIVHPESEGPAVQQAIADLRYGTIVVNLATGGAGYSTNVTPWGGHSGTTPYDVQSGIGFVQNTLMFADAHIQKSVVYNQFEKLKPIAGTEQAGVHHLFREIAYLTLKTTPERVARTAWAAVRNLKALT